MQNAAGFLIPFSVAIFVAGLEITGLSGCASAPSSQQEVHLIPQIIPSAIRIRRPAFESYDPNQSPLKSARKLESTDPLDCQTIESLFKELSIPAVRACLVSLANRAEPYEAHYRLRREIQPDLELQDPEEAPACLSEHLKVIPLPREVIFQTVATGKSFRECYTSRLDIEANQFLGVALPTDRYELRVPFPLRSKTPQDDAEVVRLLSAWVMTVFRDPEIGAFKSKYLPSILCQRCWGESEAQKVIERPDSERHVWP